MILLGIIALVLGFLLKIAILWTFGIIPGRDHADPCRGRLRRP
jgi:hypothetical protein